MNDKKTDRLWPLPDYFRQLERVRAAVGEAVYLAELRDTAINSGVKISDEALKLLAVVDYPEPDPYRQLFPHLLVFNDGRGVNLGRIARLSINTAFGPPAEDVLYQNQEFLQEVLFAPRVLSQQSIANTSKGLLALMLGDQPGQLLAGCYDDDDKLLEAPDKALPQGKNSGE